MRNGRYLSIPARFMGRYREPAEYGGLDSRPNRVENCVTKGAQIRPGDMDAPSIDEMREAAILLAGLSFCRDVPRGQHVKDVIEVLSACGVFLTKRQLNFSVGKLFFLVMKA